jgi:SAM-dependent methyltransferase
MTEKKTDTDWNQVWMDAQRKNIDSGQGGECWEIWSGKESAREFFRRSFASAKKRAASLATLINPASRVLDIGAGPGTIALSLAKKAAHVTAVEPSPGMAALFREQIDMENADNIRLIEKRWEDADADIDLQPPYDLCFASFSLGMLDLRESIMKMIDVTAKNIVLYWHAGLQPFDEDAAALSPLLSSKKHYPVPGSDLIFNLLYSMRIYPDIKVIRDSAPQVWPSFDEVFESYARRYHAVTDDQRTLLSHYLRTKFIPYQGKSVIRFTNRVSMRISWQTQIMTVTKIR